MPGSSRAAVSWVTPSRSASARCRMSAWLASGESLVAPLGELASRALVAEQLHTAIDQFVVVRERDAGLQVALQCRIGTTLGDHRASVGEQIGNTRDFEDFRFPVVEVEDDLRACDPGIAARAVDAR